MEAHQDPDQPGRRTAGAGLADGAGGRPLGLIDGQARIGGSTLQDHRRGRELETPWLNGHIVRLGRRLGVPTPANQAVLEALQSR